MPIRELRVWARTVAQRVKAGPPAGLNVTKEAWRQWVVAGRAACPASGEWCGNADCILGTRCAERAAEKGVLPSGEPMKRAQRPICGAKTRAGGQCAMRVEPGKRRCRLHGGLSTGARTAEGRERIAAAQRKRWVRSQFRADECGQGRIALRQSGEGNGEDNVLTAEKSTYAMDY